MRIGDTIYLDHQSTTPIDVSVLKEMVPFYRTAIGNPHSSDHILGWKAAQAVDVSAAKIAQLIGVDADEIIFTSGATESNNLALLGFGYGNIEEQRRRILISAIEHKCVLAAGCILRDRYGYDIELLPVDSMGRLIISSLEKALDHNVLLVSVMAVNNEVGTIQDLSLISEMVHAYGAFFHCDAAQAPCAIDLHSTGSCVDLLSLSAHKMYGPKGIGILCIRRDLQNFIQPIIHGGGQQRNLRSGTVPVHLCVGMGAAADLFSIDNAKKERMLLSRQRDQFVQKLKNLSWPITINGPENRFRHPGNLNIRFNGFSGHDILGALQPHVAASTGSACTSGIPEPSHVLRAIGLSTKEAESSIRFSLGRDTSEEDLDDAVQFIDKALTKIANAGHSHL